MSIINRNNYEAYLLDYYEQNLSPELAAELMLFIEKNTDIAENIDMNTSFFELKSDDTKFEHKAKLKHDAVENLIICEVEKLNSNKESAELYQLINSNNQYKRLFNEYSQTILIPKTEIYPDKSVLKKRPEKLIPIHWQMWSSVAAIVIVIFFIYPLIKQGVFNEKLTETVSRKATSNPTFNFKNSEVKKNYKEPKIKQIEQSETLAKKEKQQNALITSKEEIFQSDKTHSETDITVQERIEEKIEIELYQENEYVEIEPLLVDSDSNIENNDSNANFDKMKISQMIEKILGKRAQIETINNKDSEGYAINIGNFSISRKKNK
ncbi:MAG: hypothetical protein IT232_08330 [Flavobacteriales bacterium]|nr:hypothetical protein [Flavobacteriales bacterium]